jgi:hypothetical protein
MPWRRNAATIWIRLALALPVLQAGIPKGESEDNTKAAKTDAIEHCNPLNLLILRVLSPPGIELGFKV